MKNLLRKISPRALRNWARHPGKSRDYLLDRIIHACGREAEVQFLPDWTVRCHPASRDHFSVFNHDPEQRAELDAFIRLCCPGMQFLDIGAHYGLFALAAIRFGSSGARIVCVEASRKAATILKTNLRANAAEDRVNLINLAMGATDGTLEMLTTGPAGSDYYVSAPAGRSDTISVPQLSLPTVLLRTNFRPTHVKIDIEGFEDDVILGAMKTLSELRPIIFLELHGGYLRARGRDPKAVLANLRACGYRSIEQHGETLTDSQIQARNFECRLVCRAD